MGDEIKIQPSVVEGSAKRFENSSNNVNTVLTQANNIVGQLESSWTGNRSKHFQNEWRSMQPEIKRAIETLRRASTMLKKAATDFRNTDNSSSK